MPNKFRVWIRGLRNVLEQVRMSLEVKDVPNPKCQVSNQTTYLPNLFQNHLQSSNSNPKPTIGIGNPMGGI